MAITHTYGSRLQSEVLILELRQIDFETATIRLGLDTTANAEGRVVYLAAALKSLLAAQLEAVRALAREMGSILLELFSNLRGPHKGRRLQDFHITWRAAWVEVACLGYCGMAFYEPPSRIWATLACLKA
jgi:integrase